MNRIMPLPSSAPSPAASLDIDVLRSFAAIADTGTITLAAPRVGRTPAALSMQLRKLEDTLGHVLFERLPGGMRLTAAGERLMPHARRLIEAERAALDAFRAPDLEGEVSVGIIDDVAGVCLTQVLAGFAKSHPRVLVNVTMGPSLDLAPKLDRGEIDLAVMTPGCAVKWRTTDRTLYEEPLVWVGREGGSAWRQRPLPLAIAAQGCAWRRQALDALDQAGIEWRVAYISEFYTAQRAAVAADLAVAPMPRSLVEPGFVRLGASERLPDPGSARFALRVSSDAEPDGCIAALAARIAETFGAGA
ncbi:LysR family transcriptional regulator [Limibaculum sp. M0105]|uniref:LysR family transcriptional regulator n=1 Tax=Thermohalobaculum xanthum TaxID=2753746 RepID=A0A8J7MB21_9RHOB|nr:LysR family transcriptional regulator [Thermohalobaculum xanthum]MBK0401100.1 LysR family transcriptional regulator [Thermohalobaculum xanthum]